MGLDTTHNCFHGAYSAFNRWRDKLAEVAGYTFADYDGRKAPSIDWGHLDSDNVWGEWKETPADPLIVLIVHSDCEGVIHPVQAIPLADRLEELIGKLPQERDFGHIGDWRQTTRNFIDGLRQAAKKKQDVEFY